MPNLPLKLFFTFVHRTGGLLKTLESFDAIYIYRPFVDMRKQINGLAMIVESEMKLSIKAKILFVFTHKKKKILKLLYWNKTGFALWMTKLEKQTFKWPKSDQENIELSAAELELLLQGIDISKQKPHQELSYSTFS